MPKVIQKAFVGGVISPSLFGRDDIPKHAVGVRTLDNMLPTIQGEAGTRPGTEHVGEYNTTTYWRLVPFVYATTQAYQLEFSNLKMRIIKEGEIVESGGSPVEVVTPWTGTEVRDFTYTQSADTLYVASGSDKIHKITRTSDIAWTVTEITFTDGPYKTRLADSGDEDITITPSAKSGNNVDLVASSALFTADHVGRPFRFGYLNPHDESEIYWAWGIIDQFTDSTHARIDLSEDLGYELILDSKFDYGISLWRDASHSTASLTFDDVNKYAVLTHGSGGQAWLGSSVLAFPNEVYELEVVVEQVSTHVKIQMGTLPNEQNILNIQTETTPGTYTYDVRGNYTLFSNSYAVQTFYLRIDTGTSANGETVKISSVSFKRKDLSTNEWREHAFGGADSFPKVVTFHGDSLWVGNTTLKPDTMWRSKVSDYENFGFVTPFADNDSLEITLNSRQVNEIKAMVSVGNSMLVFTGGAEWRLTGADGSSVITPTSKEANEFSNVGNGPESGGGVIQPIKVANGKVLFVSRSQKRVMELNYSLDANELNPRDLTLLAPHFFKERSIIQWSYTENPNPTIWCVMDDGVMLSLVYDKDEDVYAWSKHTPAETDVTTCRYLAVSAIPGEVAGVDDLYVVVRRRINSLNKDHIERFMPLIRPDDTDLSPERTYDYWLLDDAIEVYDGGSATITGLDHLEGETVTALADGSVIRGKTVSSGEIVLDAIYDLVKVGKEYECVLETLDLEILTERGSSIGENKIVSRVHVRFRDSRGAKVGTTSDKLDEFKWSLDATGGLPPPLFTGVKTRPVSDKPRNTKSVIVSTTEPLPTIVQMLAVEVESKQDT
jgi:hypothetical protein